MAKDKAFLKEVKALGASLADDEYDLFPLVTNDANDLFAEHEAPVAPKDFLIKARSMACLKRVIASLFAVLKSHW